MIGFELTREQREAKEFAHQFAAHVVRPMSLAADRAHGWPSDFLERLALMRGAMAPGGGDAELGEAGGGVGDARQRQAQRTTLVVSEEMAWGDASVLLSLPGAGLGGPPVLTTGTAEQKQRFMSMLRRPGPRYGAYGLTEPGAGSDVSGIRTSCRKDGREWVLSGRKCYITNGARADWVVIFATLDPALGRAGHRAFVVERDTPGFSVGKIEQKMGLRASETAELVLDEVRVGEENLLGGEAHYARGKEGFMTAMRTFDSTRPVVAVMALGIARAAHEAAVAWVREAYGRARHAPRHTRMTTLLADGARQLEAARLLCYRAAWMADEGIGNSKEASMAKACAARAAMRICADAIDVMGAAGLEQHRLVEKWYRDTKVFDIFEGTGQIQRVVISRRILREPPAY